MLQLDLPRSSRVFRSTFVAAIAFLGLSLAAREAAQAARVTKVSGSSLIIDLEGADMKAGDRVLLLDGQKKKAIVNLTQVKNGRALGKVAKGSAQVGYDAQPLPAAGGGSGGGKKTRTARGSRHRGKDQTLIGGMLGYSMDNQTVTAATKESVAMTGSGFSGKALLDMPISGGLGLIGRFGAETFNLTGSSSTSACGGASGCNTSITYISADLALRYSFLDGDFQPYVSLGLGLHFPLSKSSNILDVNQISTTTLVFPGVGFYWKVAEGSYIPVHLEYGWFPPSNTVTTSLIALRAGYALTF